MTSLLGHQQGVEDVGGYGRNPRSVGRRFLCRCLRCCDSHGKGGRLLCESSWRDHWKKRAIDILGGKAAEPAKSPKEMAVTRSTVVNELEQAACEQLERAAFNVPDAESCVNGGTTLREEPKQQTDLDAYEADSGRRPLVSSMTKVKNEEDSKVAVLAHMQDSNHGQQQQQSCVLQNPDGTPTWDAEEALGKVLLGRTARGAVAAQAAEDADAKLSTDLVQHGSGSSHVTLAHASHWMDQAVAQQQLQLQQQRQLQQQQQQQQQVQQYQHFQHLQMQQQQQRQSLDLNLASWFRSQESQANASRLLSATEGLPVPAGFIPGAFLQHVDLERTGASATIPVATGEACLGIQQVQSEHGNLTASHPAWQMAVQTAAQDPNVESYLRQLQSSAMAAVNDVRLTLQSGVAPAGMWLS